jgi:hypothetical protein
LGFAEFSKRLSVEPRMTARWKIGAQRSPRTMPVTRTAEGVRGACRSSSRASMGNEDRTAAARKSGEDVVIRPGWTIASSRSLDAQLTAHCYHGAIVASFVDPVDLKPRPDPDPISVSDLAATYENGMRFVFVLIGVMLATASDGAIASLEAVLANGDEAAERFLRLAEGELDRAYRLAGPR